MYNLVDLSGKKIMITGASSGIGSAIAVMCSKLGAEVILVARSVEKLKAVAEELQPGNNAFYSFDLSQVDNIEEFIAGVIAGQGSLDGFVHSAGIPGIRPLKSLKPNIIREVMDINFFSFVEIVRCITKRNYFNPGLSIVGISSVASKVGGKVKTAYSASKAAMDLAVKCMAVELADKNIRVNTVNPALVKADFYFQVLKSGGESDELRSRMARQYMGLGEPEDVANMVAYLLSDAAKFISGSNVLLDGGRLSS